MTHSGATNLPSKLNRGGVRFAERNPQRATVVLGVAQIAAVEREALLARYP